MNRRLIREQKRRERQARQDLEQLRKRRRREWLDNKEGLKFWAYMAKYHPGEAIPEWFKHES